MVKPLSNYGNVFKKLKVGVFLDNFYDCFEISACGSSPKAPGCYDLVFTNIYSCSGLGTSFYIFVVFFFHLQPWYTWNFVQCSQQINSVFCCHFINSGPILVTDTCITL